MMKNRSRRATCGDGRASLPLAAVPQPLAWLVLLGLLAFALLIGAIIGWWLWLRVWREDRFRAGL
jgi:hypothetical protein